MDIANTILWSENSQVILSHFYLNDIEFQGSWPESPVVDMTGDTVGDRGQSRMWGRDRSRSLKAALMLWSNIIIIILTAYLYPAQGALERKIPSWVLWWWWYWHYPLLVHSGCFFCFYSCWSRCDQNNYRTTQLQVGNTNTPMSSLYRLQSTPAKL